MDIPLQTTLLLTAVAMLAGFIDSIAGGGGLLTVPAMLSAGIPPLNVLGTNKLQSVFSSSTATFGYARKGLIDWHASALTVLCVFTCAGIGALLVQSIKPSAVSIIISVLLVFVAAYVLFSPRMSDDDAHQRLTSVGYTPIGGAIGFYDGFFGPGTGSFFTTSLVALRGMGLTRAAAHTKLFNFTSNFASVILFTLGGKMIWTLGLTMAVGAMIGAWIGANTALKFGAKVIRPLLVTTSLALTARLLWQALSNQ
jgi:uncharacterized protein